MKSSRTADAISLVIFISLLITGCSNVIHERPGSIRTVFFSDSVITMKGDSLFSTVAASPDSYIISVITDDQDLRKREKRIWLACFFSVLMIGGIAALIYSRIKFRLIERLNSELQEKVGTIGDLKTRIETLDSKSDSISTTLDMILKQNIDTIRRLNDEREELGKKEDTEFYPDKLVELQGKLDTLRLEMDRLHKKVPLQKSLEKSLDSAKDEIVKRTRIIFGDSLNESDYQVLTGVFAGLSAKEISFLTGLAPGTVRTRKSRLKTRIQALPESQDKEEILTYFER